MGSMLSMAKSKVSVSVDPVKVAEARQLLGSTTLSHLIDVALDLLIVAELEQRHIAGYLAHPQQADDDAWADAPRDQSQVADDVDWARLYDVDE